VSHPYIDPSAEVLALLDEAGAHYLSGETLASRLGVSRTAVWKRVETLRAAGYDIEARPRSGYRLLGCPDVLVPSRVGPGLATACIGQHV